MRVLALLLLLLVCSGVHSAEVAESALRVDFKPTDPPTASQAATVASATAVEPMRVRADVSNDLPQAMAVEFQATTMAPTATQLPATSLTPSSSGRMPTALLEMHRSEFKRLTDERTELTKKLIEAQVHLSSIDQQIKQQLRAFEESHAELVVQDLPSPRKTPRSLSCMGWKKTSQCRWNGRRNAALDKSCFSPVSGGGAGYCEVKDTSTSEFFRVMRTNCTSVPTTATIWCQLAPQFANFPAEVRRAIAATPAPTPPPPPPQQQPPSRGIVLIAKSAGLTQLEALVKHLRSLGCALPIEIWYFEGEMLPTSPDMKRLHAIVAKTSGDIRLEPFLSYVMSSRDTPFARIHAVTYSSFAHVLYMDTAVVPLRDPTYLFSLPEFEASSAVFWPHVFHPATTQANIQPESLLWELLDMPFVDSFEQDDDLVLVKRDAATSALQALEVFASQRPNLFNKMSLLPQAKDFFRFAWIMSNTAFHMVRTPPSLAGTASGRFCGTHVVQHDPSGALLFLHPLPETVVDTPPLTTLQAFDYRADESYGQLKAAYRITSYHLQGATIVPTTIPPLQSMPAWVKKSTPPPPLPAKCYAAAEADPTQPRFALKDWQSVPESAIAQRIHTAD